MLQLFGDGRGQLDFIQNLQYKYVDLVSLELAASPEEEARESVTYRYHVLKAKLSFLQGKFKQFASLVRTKNPSLVLQAQKGLKGASQTSLGGPNHKPFK